MVAQLSNKYSTTDFEYLRKIGHGAFGVVSLVRSKQSGEVFALKQIRKDAMRKKNHRDRILAEKSLLAGGANTDCVVKLYRTFQDHECLYMVMEYLPGGDLMSHLIRLDSFTEEQTRFYIAQLVEAVHCIHRMGYIHRDVKPDNIVLTREGHLKLIDFGLCKFDPMIKLDALEADRWILPPGETYQRHKPAIHNLARTSAIQSRLPNKGYLRSSVGTAQYMAPEVLNKSYDNSSDYWSVGMIAYECLMGGTPFYDENAKPNEKPNINRILYKVARFEQFLPIPYPDKRVSNECTSFLKGILCEASSRMNYGQMRSHPFFRPLAHNWDNLHKLRAPLTPACVPIVPSPHSSGLPGYVPSGIMKDRELDFVGYTFNRFV